MTVEQPDAERLVGRVRPKPPISGVDRTFAVLDACATSRRTVSLGDLVQLTGIPKSTLHRLCLRLTQQGALDHHPDGYRIGPRLFGLGAVNPTIQRLRTASMPLLHALSSSTGHVANLAVLHRDQVLLLDEVFALEKPFPRMVGATLPLHATALGKVLLATQPVAIRQALVGSSVLPAFTRNTVVRPELLLEQLAAAARSGIAHSREEWRLGFAGVAASVRTHEEPRAAVALVGIPRAVDTERYAGAVRNAADALADALKRPVIRDASPWAGT